MKKILTVILACGMAMGASAQLLWKVEGNGLEKTSYLFGTHHIAPAAWTDSVAGLNEAILAVDEVCGEIKSADMDQTAMAQKIMQMGVAPADSTLERVLAPEVYAKADSLLAALTGMQGLLQQMNGMKPTIVSTQLAALQSMIAFPDFNPTQQLDVTVMNRGEQAGKSVAGFETVEEQLDILLGEPIAIQAEDLSESIEKWDIEIVKAQQLADAYKAQNLEAVETIMFDPETGISPEHAKRLLFDRNHNWVGKLAEWMPERGILVAVGCGHLVGDQGLISLLREAGYTVTPVENN